MKCAHSSNNILKLLMIWQLAKTTLHHMIKTIPFGRRERNGKKKKKKKYFKNILSFPLFGSLSMRELKGMERSFSYLGV
jgi:hypothetical protein